MVIVGWLMFGILILVNTAVYVGISLAFEEGFWIDD